MFVFSGQSYYFTGKYVAAFLKDQQMKKVSYLLSAIILLSASANAQRNLGVSTSDWSVMNSLVINPANIADCREKIALELFSVNAGLDNNLGSVGSVGDLVNALNNGTTGSIFNYSSKQTFSLLAPYTEVRGPGVMYSINYRHSLALTTGVKIFNQFNNFDQSLFRTLTDPDYTYEGANTGDIDFTSQKFNYTVQSWAHLGLSYGAVIMAQKEHTLKAGVTLRYLRGIGYVSMKGNNLDAHYRNNNDSVYVTNSDLEFASNLLSTRSAFTEGFTGGNVFSNLFGDNSGKGVGGDIGLVYEYMPADQQSSHRGKNDSRYKLKVSASVTDIGAITYKSTANSTAYLTGNGYITPAGLDTVHSFDEFRAYAKHQGFTADTTSKKTKVHLPTALVLGADYNIKSHWYVNATIVANLANRQNFGNSYYGQVSVTPRYDVKLFSVALPISYSMLTQHMKMGLGLRLTGFYIGSDDMLALVARNQYSFNFYMGGYVPLYKHRAGGRKTDIDSTDMSPEPDMEHGGRKDTTDDCPDMYEASIIISHNAGTAIAVSGNNSDKADMPYRKTEIIKNDACSRE
ncbi:MAG: flagellar motor protein MotB [Flavipsychrobacter sp.]|nr:flagellar motor protein MotB [Flavipsychrobacter sp.]